MSEVVASPPIPCPQSGSSFPISYEPMSCSYSGGGLPVTRTPPSSPRVSSCMHYPPPLPPPPSRSPSGSPTSGTFPSVPTVPHVKDTSSVSSSSPSVISPDFSEPSLSSSVSISCSAQLPFQPLLPVSQLSQGLAVKAIPPSPLSPSVPTIPSPPPPPPEPGISPIPPLPPPSVGIPPPPPPPPPLSIPQPTHPKGIVGLPPPPPFPPELPVATASGFSASRKQSICRKKPITPVSPMKPLFWKRVQLHQIIKPENNSCETLWETLEEPAINVEDITEMFAKVERKKEGKLVSSRSLNRIKQPVVHLLDNRRSQAVGIFLSSLHIQLDEIKDALCNVNTTILDPESLRSLHEIRPTVEELQLISDFMKKNPDALLDRPEQFLLDLSSVSCYEERLFCMMLRTTVTDSLTDIGQKLTNFRLVCEMLKTSKSVAAILGLILAFGNYMNGGNAARGQADGFELDILPKLKDVKCKDNSSNLLHYLVKVYIQKCDENAGTVHSKFPLPEPADLKFASQVTFDDIEAEVSSLRSQLSTFKKKLSNVLLLSEKKLQKPFVDVMNMFWEQSQGELNEQDQALQESKKRYTFLWRFFSVKPAIPPQDFFELWTKFTSDFLVLWKKEQQLIAKQIYEETKRKIHKDKVEGITVKPVTMTGLKLKLATSRKGNAN